MVNSCTQSKSSRRSTPPSLTAPEDDMKAPSISLIAATSLLLSMFSISAAASEVGAADTLSSHSAVDIADVYMFRDPPGSTPGPGSKLVVALTTQPLASSSFGPTYHFQENALYRLNFTTNSDAT